MATDSQLLLICMDTVVKRIFLLMDQIMNKEMRIFIKPGSFPNYSIVSHLILNTLHVPSN